MSSKRRAGNFSSCRDLSGKRIRTTEQNQRIEEHLSAIAEHQNFLGDRKRSKAEAMVRKEPAKMDNDFVTKHHESVETIESIVTKTFARQADACECEKDGKSPVHPHVWSD